MITIKKMTLIAGTVLSLVTLTAGAGFAFVQSTRGKAEQAQPSQAEQKKAPQTKGEPVDPLIQQMLDIAERRFDMVLEQFRAGEVPSDRMIDASDQIERVEMRAAGNHAARTVAKERSLKRLQRIEEYVDNLAKTGNVDNLPVLAVKLRRMQAELDLKSPSRQEMEVGAILDRLKELENKVQALEKRLPRGLGGSM